MIKHTFYKVAAINLKEYPTLPIASKNFSSIDYVDIICILLNDYIILQDLVRQRSL